MAKHGKLLGLGTAAVGVVVLGAAAFAGKDWILEEWYIRRLGSESEAEVKVAVQRLGERRSTRAAPFLVRRLAKWTEEGKGGLMPQDYWADLNGEKVLLRDYAVIEGTWVLDHDVKDALIRIGAPAVRHLIAALSDEEAWPVVWALGEMGRVARAAVPELNRQREVREPTFKAYVDEALAKIEAPAQSAPGSTPGAAEDS